MTTKTDAGPNYLKAGDLIRNGEWVEYSLKISSVIPRGTVQAADGTIINHPILSFEGRRKQLILGTLNQQTMPYATGTCVESEWVGKTIILRACMGDWFGQKNVAAIRVSLPDGRVGPFVKQKDMGRILTGSKVGIESKPAAGK